MTKRFVLLPFLMCYVLLAQAQFDFTTENDKKEWTCKTKEIQQIGTGNVFLSFGIIYDIEIKNYSIDFQFFGQQGVKEVCRRLTKKESDSYNYADGVTVSLDLSNGERLTFEKERVEDYLANSENRDKGIFSFDVELFSMTGLSNKTDFDNLTDPQLEDYMTRLLSTYDITCISLLGQRFPITKIRTAPTFDSMFTTLGQKIGRSFTNGSNRKNSTTQTDVSAKFKRTWLELDVYQNHVKGLRVHANLDVWNAKGKELRMECYFFDSSGRPLKDFNKNFYSGDGQVCAVMSFRPSYDASTYSDLSVFIPYSELHLSSGYHTIECRTTIFYGGYQYAEDNGLRFRIH